jgi:hypothetical protein
MKRKTLYISILIVLPALFFNGCKKDLKLKNSKLATDSTKTADTTLSTIANGYFNYIAADTTGDVYAMNPTYQSADTIFKFDKTGTKSVFYVTPVTMIADTVVKNYLTGLAVDSAGNVYTANTANITESIIKISPQGSASAIYTNLQNPYAQPIQELTVDGNGWVYFSDYQGIKRILTNGTPYLLVSNVTNYGMDRKGDIFYTTSTNGQISVMEVYNGGLPVTIAGPGSTQNSVTFNYAVSICADRNGNVYLGESNLSNSVIFKLKYTPYNYTNPSWSQVTVIFSKPFGHVDGPIATAEAYAPYSLCTDGAGNLYFSEATGTPTDIRKLTF